MKSFSSISKLLAAFALLGGIARAEVDLAPASPPIPMETTAGPVVPEVRRFEIVPQLSVVTVNDLALPIPGYNVNYMSSFEGLPLFTVGMGTSLAAIGEFGISIHASVGYGSRAASFSTFSLSSNPPAPVAPQSLRLQWVPAIFSTKVTYRTPHLSSIRPSLAVGVGSLMIVQSSNDPAFNRTIGIPLLVISPQLNFVDMTALHWLSGFSFGATWMKGLASDSRVNAISLDLGINLVL